MKMIYIFHLARYIFIFIFLLFLRFRNTERILDLNNYLEKINHLTSHTSYIILFINSLLLFSVLILYILVLSILIKHIKIHFFKLYYFFFLEFSNKYELQMLHLQNYLRINYYIIHFNTFYVGPFMKYYNIQYGFFHEFCINHINGFQFIIHRIILIIVIFYDYKYNHMIMIHMFKILPYVFLYEIWVKLSIFLTGLNIDFDKIVARLIYNDLMIVEGDTECYYLDNISYEKQSIYDTITKYVYHGFVDKFYLPKEPIAEDLINLLSFWKRYTIDYLFKFLTKFYLIDLLFSCLLIILIIII